MLRALLLLSLVAGTASAEDAATLSARAHAAIRAGDLVKARAAVQAELALAQPEDSRAIALALDDLGQLEEAAKDTDAARAAYGQALELRDTPEVRARLKKLGGYLPARHVLVGPKATPEELCVGCRASEAPDTAIVAPFAHVAAMIRNRSADDMVASLTFAIEIGDAWYLLDNVGDVIEGHAGDFGIDEARSIGSRLLLVWHASFGRYSHTDETKAVVCGLGSNHKVSCYGPVRIASSDFEDHVGKDTDFKGKVAYTRTIHFDCDVALRGDDLIVSNLAKPRAVDAREGLQIQKASPHACEALPSFGKHHLAF